MSEGTADAADAGEPVDTAIFFDLDGTLVQFDRPYAEIAAAAIEPHVGEATPELVEAYSEAFVEAFGALEPAPVRTGMEAVLAAAEAEHRHAADPDPEAMADSLREAECDALAVDPSVADSLAGLAESASLGVLTNGLADWQRAKLAHVDLDGYFETVVTSYEAGAHKPAPDPFELAAERLPADEYAMVGDSDDDVEGARGAGWVPIRFEDDGEGPAFWETLGALL